MDIQEPNLVDAPQTPPALAESDAMEVVRLEVRVEELERRLRARSIELETELKAKERLRERVRELTSRGDVLQETSAALHREAASASSLAHELDETLKVAAEARAQLGAALEAERSRRHALESELSSTSSALSARTAELEGDVKRLLEERETSMHKREEELAAVRRGLSQIRQKTAGHEAHIESLRSELAESSVALSASRDRIESLGRDVALGQTALEESRAAARVLEDESRLRKSDLEAAACRESELEIKFNAQCAELIQTHSAQMDLQASNAELRANKTDSELLVARAQVAELSAALSASRNSLEQSNLGARRSEDEARQLQSVIDGLHKSSDERQASEEAKSQQALSLAEQLRRESVEAFEKARELKIRQDLENERVKQDQQEGLSRLAAESERLKAKAEKLKQELRTRADREVAEMRLALDEERARLYADIESERLARSQCAAPGIAENISQQGRAIGEARRREITKEVLAYMTTAPMLSAPAPTPVAKVEPVAPLHPAPPLRGDARLRLLLYVAISVSLAAIAVAFYQI